MSDWIDDEAARRRSGVTRQLSQEQHRQVNARYPGATLEVCCKCDEPTGRAGKGEDSLYASNGDGPFCPMCWPAR